MVKADVNPTSCVFAVTQKLVPAVLLAPGGVADLPLLPFLVFRVCFKEYFIHKFRAMLGKNRVIFPGEKVSRVLPGTT